jgi:hypothetical protein
MSTRREHYLLAEAILDGLAAIDAKLKDGTVDVSDPLVVAHLNASRTYSFELAKVHAILASVPSEFVAGER